MNSENIKQLTEAKVKEILNKNGQESVFSVTTFLNSDISFVLVHLKTISSTMMLSSQWDQSLLDSKTIFIFRSDEQTKGKGTKLNSWVSPPGNLYMTILCQISLERLSTLTVFTSVKVCGLLRELYGIEPKFKWMNDIFLNNEKLGGILIRCGIMGQKVNAEIGIGINVGNSVVQGATFIEKQLKGKKVELDDLCRKIGITVGLSLHHEEYLKQQTINKYKQLLLFFNEQVQIWNFDLTSVLEKGKFLGINQIGFAIIQLQNGQIKTLSDGRMRSIPLQ